ncbi:MULTISPECIES: chloramphenicol resistance protein [Clostridium]|uniref:chloramphenicol resistance protein n=1 Tax=Clostridium TaxID=1485 RepID=UPI00098C8FA6|nr:MULTISPECIES: chloramphenicol resistance protein [Clostridium]MBA8937764.1 hypothetical protein [Clostridium beijerinckii]NRU41620.1 hypothetical protein [Clostridium beijerinckii]NSB00836.1 hypothetical protein [Clostridium beijerinckii]OOM52620.1 hypothetical protein CLOBI_53150 [Clostridium beijerinckii]OOM65595.1 hypothetical protein CLBEIC_50810 [Clostridium beijerinckii]
MTIVESIRDYIRTCPYLEMFDDAIKVNVDYLSGDADSYSIEEVPCEPIVKKYIDRSSTRQFEFIFCSREPYSENILQNIDNSGFYEKFADWIEENTRANILPIMGDGKRAEKLEVLTHGYLLHNTQNTARYQIQCKLTYFQKK